MAEKATEKCGFVAVLGASNAEIDAGQSNGGYQGLDRFPKGSNHPHQDPGYLYAGRSTNSFGGHAGHF